MNPLQFTQGFNIASGMAQGVAQGFQQVPTQRSNQMYEMKTDDAELRLLINDLYQHMGLQPRPDARMDAQFLLQHMTQEQAYGLAQQKYMDRQFAYMNGSVLERFKRMLGGHPMPPMHPQQMQQMYNQPMYQQMPPQQPVPMQPMYVQQPQQQLPPAPQGNNEVEELRQQVNNLAQMMTNYIQGQQGENR